MTVKLKGSSDGSVSLSAPADTSPSGTDITLTLPTDAGSANQFIKNSGTAGTLDYSSMVETSTGIGIGVSSPTFPSGTGLEINDSSTPRLKFSNDTTGTGSVDGIQLYVSTKDFLIENKENANMRFYTDSVERLRISNTGNVGIGTTSASQQLDIESNSTTTARVTAHGYVCRDNWGSVSSLGNGMVSPASNSLAFATNSTERMRITSGGDLLSLNTDNGIISRSTLSAGTSNTIFIGQNSASSITSGTNAIKIYTNGNIQNSNNSYGSLSDVTLKENIVDANSQWADIKGIRVRNYNFKQDTGYETFTQLGVVAQELEEVSPGLVDTDKEGIKSVNYSVLYMKAVKALQEAITKIETLETKVAALEAAE